MLSRRPSPRRILLPALLTTLLGVAGRQTNPPSASLKAGDGEMNCGESKLCGVLTLESGYGSGYYEHEEVAVHGLWPETSGYGTSKCITPSKSAADPTVVYPCYAAAADDGTDDVHQLSFEQHEWKKHGSCAGVQDSDDFFMQVCALSEAPLARMKSIKESNGTLEDMAADLSSAGYEVFSTDSYNSQIMLSACAPHSGQWVLAPQAKFSKLCGDWGDDDDDDDDDEDGGDSGGATSCVPNTHGPACKSNDDCTAWDSCVRCAGSGYCTDVPLSSAQ